MLARGWLPTVAVDGQTSRGARRADGTRVHLIAVVMPLTLEVSLSTKGATAAINLLIRLAITVVIQSRVANGRTTYQRRR